MKLGQIHFEIETNMAGLFARHVLNCATVNEAHIYSSAIAIVADINGNFGI